MEQRQRVAENKQKAVLRRQLREAAARVAEATHALMLLAAPLDKKRQELQELRHIAHKSGQEVERGHRMVRVRTEKSEGPLYEGLTVGTWRRATLSSYDQQERFVARLRVELQHLQALTFAQVEETSLRVALLAANAESVRLKELELGKETSRLSEKKAKADKKRAEDNIFKRSIQEAEEFVRKTTAQHEDDLKQVDRVSPDFESLANHVDVLQMALDAAKKQEQAIRDSQKVIDLQQHGEEDKDKQHGEEVKPAGQGGDEEEKAEKEEEEEEEEKEEEKESEHVADEEIAEEGVEDSDDDDNDFAEKPAKKSRLGPEGSIRS